MGFFSTLIQILFYQPTFNLLIWFYKYVGSLGLAIVGVALVHKLLTYSWTKKQIKSAEKNQEMQARMNTIKKQYSNNKEKQTQELAKVQAEYMPGMLGGCLNMIISLVLLIQVRNVVVNLVNEGVHAYNKVAYVDSTKYEEDYVKVTLPKELQDGRHTIEFVINSTANIPLDKTIDFGIQHSSDEAEKLNKEIVAEQKKESKSTENSTERKANIGLYIDAFKNNTVLSESPISLTAYLRPPSGEKIVYDGLQVKIDGELVPSENIITHKGDSLNLEFIGADLSRVASDYQLTDYATTWPYILISITVGISQFFASKIQMGMRPNDSKKDQEKKQNQKSKKKNKGEDEMPDFAEAMAESSKNMTYIFPFLTILMSLGYMGGGNIFPTGVSLFWTAQNTFVIIQQVVMHPDKVKQFFKEKFKFIEKIKNEK